VNGMSALMQGTAPTTALNVAGTLKLFLMQNDQPTAAMGIWC